MRLECDLHYLKASAFQIGLWMYIRQKRFGTTAISYKTYWQSQLLHPLDPLYLACLISLRCHMLCQIKRIPINALPQMNMDKPWSQLSSMLLKVRAACLLCRWQMNPSVIIESNLILDSMLIQVFSQTYFKLSILVPKFDTSLIYTLESNKLISLLIFQHSLCRLFNYMIVE